MENNRLFFFALKAFCFLCLLSKLFIIELESKLKTKNII